jgi:hypothetical protein
MSREHDPDIANDDAWIERAEEDERLAAISRDLSLGNLSPDEAVLLPGNNPVDNTSPELASTLLYFHLKLARDRKFFMDRNAWGPAWIQADRERNLALADAQRHYRTLLARGAEYIDNLLGQMIASEGLVA